MRICMFIIILLNTVVLHDSMGQFNFVQNPSFEDSIFCPDLPSPNITSAKYWAAYRGTPDYLHSCANSGPFYPNGQPIFGVPLNIGGYQNAFHGEAYAGFYTWCCIYGSHQREFLGTILSTFLTVGTTYYFSCYISNGDSVESNSSTNNIGVKLSTIPYNGTPGFVMATTNFSHLKMDSIVSEKNSWVKFSGSIVADSAYRFLAIGNFYDDYSTLIDSTQGVSTPLAYYYVDAVCLSTDSMYCQNWTSTKSPEKNDLVTFYPNPAIDQFIIENEIEGRTLTILDFRGRLLKSYSIRPGSNTISISDLDSGIYLLVIDNRTARKLVVEK